jgi:hypothetical protein
VPQELQHYVRLGNPVRLVLKKKKNNKKNAHALWVLPQQAQDLGAEAPSKKMKMNQTMAKGPEGEDEEDQQGEWWVEAQATPGLVWPNGLKVT